MSDKKKYFKNIKLVFPMYTKTEKMYLEKYLENVGEELDYNSIVEEFGTPMDVVHGYFEDKDMNYLMNGLNKKRMLKRFYLIVICILIIGLSFFVYYFKKTYEIAQEEKAVKCEEYIVDGGWHEEN